MEKSKSVLVTIPENLSSKRQSKKNTYRNNLKKAYKTVEIESVDNETPPQKKQKTPKDDGEDYEAKIKSYFQNQINNPNQMKKSDGLFSNSVEMIVTNTLVGQPEDTRDQQNDFKISYPA